MQELLERKKGLHRSVLIVDDEFIEREMLGAMLSDIYEVSYAENGSHALDIIKRDKLTLSLVILDLHMPELDGYSLLKIIRSDSELRRIPVIVLTSEKDGKVSLVSMATDSAVKLGAHAGNLIKAVAPVLGGGGGGRPNMAQAGGKDASKIKEALEKAKEVAESQIK